MKKAVRSPLPLPIERWRSRWLVFANVWDVLHRVSEITWDDDEEMIQGRGVTVCGRRGLLAMPGIFSRMDRPRCPACCRRLAIPEGDGAPFNTANVPWQDA